MFLRRVEKRLNPNLRLSFSWWNRKMFLGNCLAMFCSIRELVITVSILPKALTFLGRRMPWISVAMFLAQFCLSAPNFLRNFL